MGNYKDIKCVSCENVFTDADDVVVCPDCGAPHHRTCFKELRHCALSDKHSSAFIWEKPKSVKQENAEDQNNIVICNQCRSANNSSATYCQACGSMLKATGSQGSFFETLNRMKAEQLHEEEKETWEVNTVSSQELSSYFGASSYYFLPRIKNLLKTKHNSSWNWAAFFFHFLYFFYRKLYLLGGLLLAFYVLTSIPSVVYCLEFIKAEIPLDYFGVSITYNEPLLNAIYNMLPYFNMARYTVYAACAVFANKSIFAKALKDISALKDSDIEVNHKNIEYKNKLSDLGRPNIAIVLVLISVQFAIYSFIFSTALNSIAA